MSNHSIGNTLYEQANGRVTKWEVIAVSVDPKYFNPYNERVLVITMRSEGPREPSYCAVTKDALDAKLRDSSWSLSEPCDTDADTADKPRVQSAHDCAIAMGHVDIAPDWYIARTKDWPADHPKPPPYDVGPWQEVPGGQQYRCAFAPFEDHAAEVNVVERIAGMRALVTVCDRKGRKFKLYAKNPAEGREISDILLKGLGWPV